MQHFDVIIVGGGIVGLATAYQLLTSQPARRLLIVEKEATIGVHQTGHNSGVLHSGIYYRPGSLRAANCRSGKQAMERFCAEHGIDYEICGKVIVAVDERELPLLANIYERGQANGVRCEMIGRERLSELEPHAAGIRAIHVPEAGIVNYRQVAAKLGELIRQAGGEIACGARVVRIAANSRPVVVETTAGAFSADYVVTCAGLHADRVTRLAGQEPPAQIVPFRGEYYEVKPSAHRLCRNLIYPVPDPNFPFLGVHFTRTIDGGLECGPNAVLAFAREGYRWRTISPRDLAEALTYPGFLRLAGKHWRAGAAEMWRSLSKRAFVRALQRLVPEVRGDDLVPAPAGVRAQAVHREGKLADDFLICSNERVINICNAPSPAATASLNIGRIVADKLAEIQRG
jgi:L-2-hydroxyglutarate oxidase